MLKLITDEIKRASRPEKVEIFLRFFKTKKGEYGEGDKFLGVVVPDVQKIAQKYYREITYQQTQELLESEFHEIRLLALLILIRKYSKADENEKKDIYDLYLKNTKCVNNWDLVDVSARKIVGNYLLTKERNILYKLAVSKNLWERRIAIIATHEFILHKQYEDTFKIAKILIEDKHDLIHKAVGWMLREAGKHGGEKQEKEFLEKYYKIMPRTMLRYAIERFPEKIRREYLKGVFK